MCPVPGVPSPPPGLRRPVARLRRERRFRHAYGLGFADAFSSEPTAYPTDPVHASLLWGQALDSSSMTSMDPPCPPGTSSALGLALSHPHFSFLMCRGMVVPRHRSKRSSCWTIY